MNAEPTTSDAADRLTAAIKRLVRNAVAKRLAPLEARLAALESPTAATTKGVTHENESEARRTRRKK